MRGAFPAPPHRGRDLAESTALEQLDPIRIFPGHDTLRCFSVHTSSNPFEERNFWAREASGAGPSPISAVSARSSLRGKGHKRRGLSLGVAQHVNRG